MAVTTRSFFSFPVLLSVFAVFVLAVGAFAFSVNGTPCTVESPKASVPAYHRHHDVVNEAAHNAFAYEKEDKKTIGFLGIQIAPYRPYGVRVARTFEDFNAYKAGFAAGDVIVELNDTPINSPAQLQRLITGTKPGTRVEVVVLRSEQPVVLYPTVGAITLPVKNAMHEHIRGRGPCQRNR